MMLVLHGKIFHDANSILVLKDRHYPKNLGINGSITLKCILGGSGIKGCGPNSCDLG
jgi:hypothetical protein